MGDFDDFGEGVDTRRGSGTQLLLGHVAQSAHKLHNRLAVQQATAHGQKDIRPLQEPSMDVQSRR